jgi:hypothetical protein
MSPKTRATLSGIGVFLTFTAFYLGYKASHDYSFVAIGLWILALSCLVLAGICFAPGLIGFVASPFTSVMGSLFHPHHQLTAPPEDLLRALRRKIMDRQFTAAGQQLDALLRAYGPSPALYHLCAHYEAAQGRDPALVNSTAAAQLKPRALAAYQALLRQDAPPLTPPPTPL